MQNTTIRILSYLQISCIFYSYIISDNLRFNSATLSVLVAMNARVFCTVYLTISKPFALSVPLSLRGNFFSGFTHEVRNEITFGLIKVHECLAGLLTYILNVTFEMKAFAKIEPPFIRFLYTLNYLLDI